MSRTEQVFRRAGWRPGRSVPTATWESILHDRGSFVAHDAARRFLSEFGGLVTYGWPADSITTSAAIRFDPLVAEWQHERLAEAGRDAGARLYPVGASDEGVGLLGMSEAGALHLVRDRVKLLASTTDRALDRLVDAHRNRSHLWVPAAPRSDHAFWQRLDTAVTGPEAGPDAKPRSSGETERLLRAGGWFPGRSVPTDTWEGILLEIGQFEMPESARRFLAEFGAVTVPYRSPRTSMPCPEFSLDPLLAFWDAEIIEDLSEQAGVTLYPIGMRDRRNRHLLMAEDGAVYEGMDSVWLLAPTPDQAVERLTGGVGSVA
ncbi:SUKH-3 domain-containing protein [Streptomyces sp. NPDC058737]|uniref:SUKH-3 domain-containing protein n=1 Tax=Streptomyces sp. NPDC058737 TaxID=3346617 RepID=UPI0036B04CE8